MEQTKTSKLVSVLLAFVLSFSMLGTASLGIFADTAYAADDKPASIVLTAGTAADSKVVSQLVLQRGATQSIEAVVYSDKNTVIDDAVVEFSSNNQNVSVEQGGTITAVDITDSATVTASYKGVSATCNVEVSDFVFADADEQAIWLTGGHQEQAYTSEFIWGRYNASLAKTVGVGSSDDINKVDNEVKVAYSVADEKIAVFDEEDVKVIAKQPGTTVVTATVTYKDENGVVQEPLTAKSVVTVFNPPSGVALFPGDATAYMFKGQVDGISAEVKGPYEYYGNKEVGLNPDSVYTWKSNDEGIIAVEPTGDSTGAKVTAVNPGTTTVTFKSRSGNVVTTKTTTYVVDGLGLNRTSVSLPDSGSWTYGLAASFYDHLATNPDVDVFNDCTWTSSDESVATISLDTTQNKAVVKGIKAGSATITATYTNPITKAVYTATCVVTVGDPIADVAVTVEYDKAAGYNVGDVRNVTAKLVNKSGNNPKLSEVGGTIRWESSDPAVVVVEGTGEKASFETLKPGVANIYAIYNSGAEGAKDVKSDDSAVIIVNGLAIVPGSVTLNADYKATSLKTYRVNGSVPSSSEILSVEWEIEEGADNVIVLKSESDKSATITAIGGGTATVTAKYENAKSVIETATCVITVENPATAITVDPAQVTLDQGATSQLTASTEGPLGKDTKVTNTITWASSDEKVATVDENGLVTAVAAGSATITATAGNVNATCAVTVNGPTSTTMYRLYNPNSGEHFFTVNAAERDMLVNAGWDEEDNGAPVPTSGKAVYRLYNQYGGEHHYTLDEGEVAALVAVGWTDEGVAFYSADETGTPMYRVYNPNAYANNHHYTPDENEKNYLVTIGWKGEGIGWYGV